MGDARGFLSVERVEEDDRPVAERVRDWRETTIHAPLESVRRQASRCMECGIPFCHGGCPLGNLVPEWNDLVYKGELDLAAARLHETNNFPEVTGRICPAPCEASCVLNLQGEPVTIKTIERTIADAASYEPRPADRRSGRRVAVVGSGPAGLAAAQELARKGHDVTVFERDDRIGGLLRYGIPDFKLEKSLLDRRLDQLAKEGVAFHPRARVTASTLAGFDASVLACGARAPRDLPVPGRTLDGIHFAMDFLVQQNRRGRKDREDERPILATGKRVVVIGGGDTGSDCVGTSIRQGCASVLQLELMPRPDLVRRPENPWPEWPFVLRTSTSHEEGAERDWAVSTRGFRGEAGRVTALDTVRVVFQGGKMHEVANGEWTIEADLVLLAMGFVGPQREGLVAELGLDLDARGNVSTDLAGRTSVRGVFAAGDMSRGQSLVVWAIADGRRVAAGVHTYLSASSQSPSPSPSQSPSQSPSPSP